MIFLSLSRVIRFSFQNFIRNIWLSVVTITIVVLTLFSVTSLVFMNAILEQSIKLVESRVDVSVYFKPTITPEQVFVVQTNVETLPYVNRVQYVSKSDALDKLRKQYNDSPLILEAIKELDDNPLGDTLVISAKNTGDYQKIVDVLKATPQYAVLIDRTSFDDNTFVIDKLQKISAQVTTIGWGITFFFVLVSLMVIINTIRVAIYTHRDEIGIMKLVGASNTFVRGPFVGEAMLYAIVGAIITFVLSYFFANISDPYIVGLLGQTDFTLLQYLKENVLLIFGGELLGIIFISVIATWFALSRYLRV